MTKGVILNNVLVTQVDGRSGLCKDRYHLTDGLGNQLEFTFGQSTFYHDCPSLRIEIKAADKPRKYYEVALRALAYDIQRLFPGGS